MNNRLIKAKQFFVNIKPAVYLFRNIWCENTPKCRATKIVGLYHGAAETPQNIAMTDVQSTSRDNSMRVRFALPHDKVVPSN